MEISPQLNVRTKIFQFSILFFTTVKIVCCGYHYLKYYQWWVHVKMIVKIIVSLACSFTTNSYLSKQIIIFHSFIFIELYFVFHSSITKYWVINLLWLFCNMQLGYRHFDTAKIYGSEPAVGNALRKAILDKTIEREDVFVTSKLWGSDHHDPVSALKQTLQ